MSFVLGGESRREVLERDKSVPVIRDQSGSRLWAIFQNLYIHCLFFSDSKGFSH